jgi:hypothetical protein
MLLSNEEVIHGYKIRYTPVEIEVAKWNPSENSDFLNLLGYINTEESAQMRGASGYVR